MKPPKGPNSRRLQEAWNAARTDERLQVVLGELRELSRLLTEAADALERDDHPTYTDRLMQATPLLVAFLAAMERGVAEALRAARRDAEGN